jgi:hypothetical protein
LKIYLSPFSISSLGDEKWAKTGYPQTSLRRKPNFQALPHTFLRSSAAIWPPDGFFSSYALRLD